MLKACDILLLQVEHDRDRGAIDVGVEKCHRGAGVSESDSEVDGHGAFADATFARSDKDDMFDTTEGGVVGRRSLRLTRSKVDRDDSIGIDEIVNSLDTLVGHTLFHRAGGGSEDEVERDLFAVDDNILDHAELDETLTEVGVVDMAESHFYLSFGNHSKEDLKKKLLDVE